MNLNTAKGLLVSININSSTAKVARMSVVGNCVMRGDCLICTGMCLSGARIGLTPTPTPTPVIHVIQYGETLSHVAVKYGVTIDALITRNNIDDPRGLQVGAKIIIPVKR